jgi:hypothetical protein
MNVKYLSALVIAGFLALTGAGMAQAAPLPLSPATQQNAKRSAKQYLDMQGFSHDGLIKQLEYENYTPEDATWAADNVNADWNQQAARSAKQYVEMQGFSHDGLVTTGSVPDNDSVLVSTSATVYLGPAGVTTSTGFALTAANGPVKIPTTGAETSPLYGITSSGTATVSYIFPS